MKRVSSGIVFFLLGAELVIGQTILNEEFWYDLQPELEGWETVQGKEQFPDLHTLSKDEMFNRILEEARYVFSGMVYGFIFSYTPYDRSRGVEEEFLLEPYQWIQRGDPNLQVFGVVQKVPGYCSYPIFSCEIFRSPGTRGSVPTWFLFQLVKGKPLFTWGRKAGSGQSRKGSKMLFGSMPGALCTISPGNYKD
jgi:hypothetical protein